ncbi:MAG: hypothetical protein ACP5I8_11245 [Phycisphaerae bacterium]
METAAIYSRANEILRRAFAAGRHTINLRLAVRRIGAGMALGLLLCFPLLVLLLLAQASVVEIIEAMALLNVITIVIRLWRGPWAGEIDAAIYLEHKYRQPGLFITAAEYVASDAGAVRPQLVPLRICCQAARVCEHAGAQRVNALPWTPVSTKIWAGNGLLLMGLFIAVLLGRAMTASSSTTGRKPVAMGGTERSQIALRYRGPVSPTGIVKHSFRATLSPVKKSPIAVRLPVHQTRFETLEIIQHAMARLLHKATTPSAGAARSNPQDTHGSGASLHHGRAALKSQLLAAARLPGIGVKISTVLMAAAHAIHASSQGDFPPQLRSLNQQLKAYLKAASPHSAALADHPLAQAHPPQYGHGGGGRGNTLVHAPYPLRAGNSQRAIVLNIPPAQNHAKPTVLSWGESNRGHATVIPTRYRDVVRSYFSNASATP